jgi:prepilin signal peptidase PulO-like enzyme (type II secretory pathway)
MGGRSRCLKCGKQIFWYDNIPILSFILLRGKCRHCGKAISWQYPVVELVTGILFVLAFAKNFEFRILNLEFVSDFGFRISDLFQIHNLLFIIQIFRDWFIIAVMIVIFVIDLKWYLILDIVALPAGAVVFVLNLILYLTPHTPPLEGGQISWQNLLISGIIGMSFFLIQFLISKGKWIGGGDIRLGLLMGLVLGWPNIIVAILSAYFMGSIVGLGLIAAKKKKWESQVPLGVFLSSATIIALFWGEKIASWYLGLI